MADDIVTRLREVCMCKGITCPHDGMELEAADEIERLRKLVDVYMDLYASEIVRKAVRGE